MKFGKLFKSLILMFPEFKDLSSNRCSELSYAELRKIAKTIYSMVKQGSDEMMMKNYLAGYMRMSHKALAICVYKSLVFLFD